jgi:hypothetical protein
VATYKKEWAQNPLEGLFAESFKRKFSSWSLGMHRAFRMGGGLGFSVASLCMICVTSQTSLHFNAPRSMSALVIGWDFGLWLLFTSGQHLVKPGNTSPSQICSEESRPPCVLCAGDQSNEIEHVDNKCDIQ